MAQHDEKINNFNAALFRQKLHQYPELSCCEVNSANVIAQQLVCFGLIPIRQVGGHGIVCIIDGEHDGETTLLRADFDALPIHEKASHDHVSVCAGVMHACGHDGHTASLLSVAQTLSQTPPKYGRVILLFQPAEEIGVGAKAMLSSAEMADLKVDHAFAYHNLPGYPLHQVILKKGTFTCASTGVCIELEGKTSHAAYPENGINPVNAMVETIEYLQSLPKLYSSQFSLVTIVHAGLGEQAFGVSAGDAKVMATIRSACNETFWQMQQQIVSDLNALAELQGLTIRITWHEPFNATVNNDDAVVRLEKQARRLGLAVSTLDKPLRWSEDFAEFLLHYPGALFCLGSGQQHPELHNPDYDFPDELLTTAVNVFIALVRDIHG